jgi:hypothetical protein
MPLAVGIIALALALINSWHVIVPWIQRPPDAVFTGIAHYFADFFLYIAQMREGTLYSSHWFTNEPMAATWIYWFNGLVGRAGSIVGLSPFATYNITLIALVLGLCVLWWALIKRVFADNFTRLVAFVFVLTASQAPNAAVFWFSPTPALNRLGGVPHQMLQTLFILAVIYIFIARPKSLLIIPLAFLASTANPIQMLLVVAAAALIMPKRLPMLAIPALIGAVLVNKEFAAQPVLIAAKAWEAAQHIRVGFLQFLLSIGPIVLLIPFGVKRFLKQKDPLRRLFFAYGALSMAVFFSPIPTLLGTASVRWLSPAAYALLPLLAAAGLPKSRYKFLLLALYVLVTTPVLASQVGSRMTPQPLNYVSRPVVDGISQLEKEPDGVVLTDPLLPYDVLIPVFAQHSSFTGHPIHTLYPEVKERLREEFFSGIWSEEQTREFLTNHRIGYVITVVENSRFDHSSLVHKLYQNEVLTLFQTNL